MCTPRRVLERAVAACLAVSAATACAREAVVIADGLVAPVGVAVSDSGDRLVVVDRVASDAGRLYEYRVTNGNVSDRREVEAVAAGAARWVGETLLIADRSVFAYPVDLDASAVARARPPQEQLLLGAPAATDRFAFAVDRAEGRLWRTRRVERRFTNLRVVESEAASPRLSGVVVSPAGYLVTVATSSTGDATLQFRAPEQPETVKASLPVRGLGSLLDMACGVADREQEASLFALTDKGVFRLESTLVSGAAGCRAVRILEVDEPTAFSIGAGDTIYITTAKGELLLSEADE